MKRRLTLLLTTLALTSLSFAACGNTGGRPITVNLFAEGDGDTFTTATGWTVTLTDAHLVLGPVYLLAPIATTLRSVILPVAYAHGGHDDFAGRTVRAEWLEQASVDLLAIERTSLGIADGSAGPAGDVTVLLEPPVAASSSASHGHHAWLAGTAVMGAASISFEGGLDIPDDGLSRQVEGIPASGDYDTDGEVTLTAHVSSWLDQMHFDRLPEPAVAEPRVIAAGSQPYAAWYIGARTSSAFSTRYVAPGGR